MATRKTGRKTKYNKKLLPIIRKLRQANTPDYKIAEKLGISESTWYSWKNPEHKQYKPELVKALAIGYEQLADDVESDTVRSTHGFFIEEEETRITGAVRKRHTIGEDGIPCPGCPDCKKGWIVDGGKVDIFKHKKYIPPNGYIQWNLLKNMKPEKYRDKTEMDHTIKGLTLAELVIQSVNVQVNALPVQQAPNTLPPGDVSEITAIPPAGEVKALPEPPPVPGNTSESSLDNIPTPSIPSVSPAESTSSDAQAPSGPPEGTEGEEGESQGDPKPKPGPLPEEGTE